MLDGSSGAATIRPGTRSPVAGCSAGGCVTVGNSATAALSLSGMPAAAKTAADPPKPWPTTPSLVGCTLILPVPSRTPSDDVERGTQVERQVEHRRRDPGLGVRRRGDDAPRRKVFQRAVIAIGAGQPVVAECHAGQVHPGLGGVDDARQAGKGQVTAQNAVRAPSGQRSEELLRLGHPMTVAHHREP